MKGIQTKTKYQKGILSSGTERKNADLIKLVGFIWRRFKNIVCWKKVQTCRLAALLCFEKLPKIFLC